MTKFDLGRADFETMHPTAGLCLILILKWFISVMGRKTLIASGQLGAHVLACCAWNGPTND